MKPPFVGALESCPVIFAALELLIPTVALSSFTNRRIRSASRSLMTPSFNLFLTFPEEIVSNIKGFLN